MASIHAIAIDWNAPEVTYDHPNKTFTIPNSLIISKLPVSTPVSRSNLGIIIIGKTKCVLFRCSIINDDWFEPEEHEKTNVPECEGYILKIVNGV